MNLDHILRALTNIRTSTIVEACIVQLTENINRYGKPQVIAAIREAHGMCPHIENVGVTNEYYFRKFLCRVNIDGIVQYIHYSDLPNILSGQDYYYDRDGVRCVETNPIMYHGYSLRYWIELGEICEECGSPFIRSGTSTICGTCASQYQLKPYNYKVEEDLGMEDIEQYTLFNKEKQNKHIRYGVELEYENITPIDVYKTLKGHALPKSDGSIHSGVEIVTRPACIASHKDKLATFYAKIKVQAASNTGMHVHIERKGLSQYRIGFIMEFLNKDTLLKFNELIAGREYSRNTYCRPNPSSNMTTGIMYDTHTKKLIRSETDKYTPVNTRKTHTIEIRIFSSPETHEECSAKLDFVSALVQYSSPYSVSAKSLKDKFTKETFLKYVMDNRKEFKDFYNYYIKSEKLTQEGAL